MTEEQERMTSVLEAAAVSESRAREKRADSRVGVVVFVPVSELPTPENVDPSDAMKASVRTLGILAPILLADDGRTIVAGKRRVAAAKAVLPPDATVPVRYVTKNKSAGAAMTLVENYQRSANVVAEWLAIEQLLKDGYSESVIARELAVPVGRMRRLMKLSALPPALRRAIEKGTVLTNVALAMTTLDAGRIAALASLYEVKGTLTHKDVKASRTAGRSASMDALPDALFAADVVGAARRVVRLADAEFDEMLGMLEAGKSWCGDEGKAERIIAAVKAARTEGEL